MAFFAPPTRRAALLAASNSGALAFGATTIVDQNTTATNDLSSDGYTWANGSPLVVDQYGKLIAWAQAHRSGDKRHLPVVSNDSGATWSQPTRTGFFDAEGEGFLIRPAQVYDPGNDLLHVCWTLTQGDGGVYYREYSFTRDGSNNITGVTRVRQMQLEVGVAGMTFDSPAGFWAADLGAVVFAWGASNGSGVSSKACVRASMLVPDGTGNDTTAANWKNPLNNAASDSDPINSSMPAGLGFGILCKSASSQQPFIALGRKPTTAASLAGGLVWFQVLGGIGEGRIRYNHATFATTDWSGGLGAAISNETGLITVTTITQAGTDAGYTDKHQLVSKTAYDPIADRLWVGFTTWKSDTAGDTWSFAGIKYPASLVSGSPFAAYEATSSNTDAGRDMFVAGDVMYDATSGYLIVSYTDLPTHHVYLAAYDSTGARVLGPTLVYDTTPADIPTLYDTRIASKIAILFRTFNAEAANNPPTYTAPYDGIYESVEL